MWPLVRMSLLLIKVEARPMSTSLIIDNFKVLQAWGFILLMGMVAEICCVENLL